MDSSGVDTTKGWNYALPNITRIEHCLHKLLLQIPINFITFTAPLSSLIMSHTLFNIREAASQQCDNMMELYSSVCPSLSFANGTGVNIDHATYSVDADADSAWNLNSEGVEYSDIVTEMNLPHAQAADQDIEITDIEADNV
ncbi:hypothetical protein CERSUDRAFT_95202 [Gelatoporia subvermispora B]|uniref:Uncharacterized protein n=1 Tax=Ceriporiopsis subvermispora (strain B) TaxID=914234 RepID=M2RES7_CERS8|nr:hypothetical protein CERSUDRAFT_95202 [Gelatoporia subvermispora B]